jgi:hypothetical protein
MSETAPHARPHPGVTIGKITSEESLITIGKITIGKITVGKITIGKITVGKITIGKITVGKITFGKKLLLAFCVWKYCYI